MLGTRIIFVKGKTSCVLELRYVRPSVRLRSDPSLLTIRVPDKSVRIKITQRGENQEDSPAFTLQHPIVPCERKFLLQLSPSNLRGDLSYNARFTEV